MACFSEWRDLTRRNSSFVRCVSLLSLLFGLHGCNLNPRGELPGASEGAGEPQASEGPGLDDLDDSFGEGAAFPDSDPTSEPSFEEDVDTPGDPVSAVTDVSAPDSFDPGAEDPLAPSTDEQSETPEPEPEPESEPPDWADAGVAIPADGGVEPPALMGDGGGSTHSPAGPEAGADSGIDASF